MHKIIFRPVCHLSFQQANSIYEDLRSSQALYSQQGSLIQRPFDQSPYSNSVVSNNNQINLSTNHNEKNLPPNTRNNRLTSLPQNPQFSINNPNSYSPQLPHNVHMSPVDNKNSQKIISKDSIIRKYDDFFGQKVNAQALKEQNSRLYYQKLALEASVQKLKEQNIKKDHQISRLKQFIENTKNTQNNPPKQIQGFQSQVVNQPSHQVHFRSTFEQKRPF